VVITNAGTAGGDVKALVYVDAFIPEVGETVFQIVASQRPITLGANTSPTETAAWKTLPSLAVVGTEDRVIPPATQRSMAERAGSTITEIAGSHVSMVSHPAAAIEAILAAVAAVDG
jgi:pimeloyl-ACP methyl ester carboxylesterase